MVYEKKQSGDPDFDDKVPAGMHSGYTVTAGDGKPVHMTDNVGPTDQNGAHVNLDPVEDEDNRPAPGEVAEKPSPVQEFTPDPDGPGRPVDLGEVSSQEEADRAVAKAKGEDPDAGNSKATAPALKPEAESQAPAAKGATKPANTK